MEGTSASQRQGYGRVAEKYVHWVIMNGKQRRNRGPRRISGISRPGYDASGDDRAKVSDDASSERMEGDFALPICERVERENNGSTFSTFHHAPSICRSIK
jgi:hypothetical protein